MILSHRILRYGTPALHAIALVANLLLVIEGASMLYAITLALQIALLAAAGLGGVVRVRPLLLARYYVLTTTRSRPACGIGCDTGTEAHATRPRGRAEMIRRTVDIVVSACVLLLASPLLALAAIAIGLDFPPGIRSTASAALGWTDGRSTC